MPANRKDDVVRKDDGAREGLILALDQGTTSTRAMLFNHDMQVVATDQQEFPQHFPASGHVEHDAEDLWRTSVETMRGALAKAGVEAAALAGIGITNQRETTVVWDRETGRAIHPAIVWQDRRTARICGDLKRDGHEQLVRDRSGLLLDPYFSATKASWILDTVPGARAAAEAGKLAFGTVDAFLIWRMTGGRVHATDATNASRTMLYDIHRGAWCPDLCKVFGVPMGMLPEVRDSAGDFGETLPDLLGVPVPIRGVAGDQQAATTGQACFRPGMVKATYGTGCFALLVTGNQSVRSRNRLLTTVALQLNGRRSYALEGSIFVAGAAVQWLRDGLGLIENSAQTEVLAAEADPAQSVYLVPAFTGLGAPHWDADARGAMFGLTRATGPREIARAVLDSVAYQTRDLVEAMRGDWEGDGFSETVLRVDGGMVASDWLMQRLADMLATPVDRPKLRETTAMGAAYLAGLATGVYPDPEVFAEGWALDRRFEPGMAEAERERLYGGWQDAVRRTLTRS
ncbi:glycerol kinase GlpK [Tistrella mobilis]|jgi:glycerol kinase|uniref:Glycerol kinase n=1 Tax=Tistrella mobilis (strain KA081020-065) TaxID=1110502 RepID=I3THP5_TISMK|nr:glycerol kinase GlpK [Tistrella mobilis]AFK52283.1 glycerol kinase [Tistrella mobilis KA081020-065]